MDFQKEIRFTLKSFSSPSRPMENLYMTQDCDAHCLLTPPSYYEDDSCALTSDPSSPLTMEHARPREVEQLSPTSLFFRSPAFSRRRSSALHTASPVEDFKRNVVLRRASMLHSGTVPSSREHEMADKSALRRASTTTCTPMQRTATRKPSFTMSEKSVKMRRESVFEKIEIEENLSRSTSPSMKFNPIVVPRRKVESPCIKAQSSWTSEDPVYKITPGVTHSQEMEDSEDDEIELVTARRVSLAEYQALPFYLKASKFPAEEMQTRRSSTAWPGTWSDAGSNAPKTTEGRGSDLVSVVTALQAAHLEETRRLNELIANLSTKVATLESDLLHMSADTTIATAGATISTSTHSSSSSSSSSTRASTPLITPTEEVTSWQQAGASTEESERLAVDDAGETVAVEDGDFPSRESITDDDDGDDDASDLTGRRSLQERRLSLDEETPPLRDGNPV